MTTRSQFEHFSMEFEIRLGFFATTEAEKIPATILSRCQRYDFRNIPTRRIAEHLKTLCDAEDVPAEADALFRVARAAAGSMRDALSLLDQMLASGAGVTDTEVVNVLGTPPDERTLAIASAIATGQTATALTELSAVLEGGVTLTSAAGALSDVFRNLMLAATCGGGSELIELPEQQRKAVAELAKRFSVPTIVQAVGIMQTAARNIRTSSVARALLYGRSHVSFEDIRALALPVLRHRVLINYRAEAEGVVIENLVERLLKSVKESHKK